MSLVSVILPAYNAGEYLLPAVQSVLQQTHRELELIVVDDGSTDGSVDAVQSVIDDKRVQWFRQENAGKSTALNFALERIQGEFYLLQDADDLSYPNRIENMLNEAQRQPNVAAIFSGYDLVLGDCRLAPVLRTKTIEQCKQDIDNFRMPSHDPTGMYRMSMTRDYRYEPSLRVGQGFDYILRIGEEHPMAVLGECLYSYRINWDSITHSNPERRDTMVELVMRRAYERRGLDFSQWQAMRRTKPKGKRALEDNNLQVHFMKSVQDLRDQGQLWTSISAALKCVRLSPWESRYYKPLVLACCPDKVRQRFASHARF